MVSCVNVFSDHQQKQHRNALRQFLPAMMSAVTRALERDETEDAIEAMKLLIQVVEYDISFLLPQAVPVLSGMFTIAGNKNFDERTRDLAVEFITQFSEASPKHARKVPDFAKNCVLLFLQLMTEIEEVPMEEWNATVYHMTNESASLDEFNDCAAIEALDRVSIALGGEVIVPVIFEHIPRLLKDTSSWRPRHLGLLAMVHVFEGCREQLFESLGALIEMTLPCFEDQHPRVRHAATHVFGQISIDFAPIAQQDFHRVLLTTLTRVLDDNANPKCQAHACAAILNVVDQMESDTFKPYIDVLLTKIYPLIKRDIIVLQNQALLAVSTFVAVAGSYIAPYYPAVMSLMMEIVTKVTSSEMQVFRGKAVEGVGILAVSAKEQFMKGMVPLIVLFFDNNRCQTDC